MFISQFQMTRITTSTALQVGNLLRTIEQQSAFSRARLMGLFTRYDERRLCFFDIVCPAALFSVELECDSCALLRGYRRYDNTSAKAAHNVQLCTNNCVQILQVQR